MQSVRHCGPVPAASNRRAYSPFVLETGHNCNARTPEREKHHKQELSTEITLVSGDLTLQGSCSRQWNDDG